MLETIVIYGIILTALYSLIALGFWLIFSVADIINLTHGMIIISACYVVFMMVSVMNCPLWLGIPLGIMAAVILTLLLYGTFIRRMLIAPHTSMILLTAGLAMVIQQAIILLAGPQTKFVPEMVKGSVHILGVVVSWQQILSLAVASVITVAMGIFLHKGKMGRAIRAVSQENSAAQLSGINPESVFILTVIIAGALAGTAGVLVAPLETLIPELGWETMVTAFTITVLAGLGGPVWSVVIAAAIVAYSELLTSFYISPELKEASAFMIMILTLMFKPSGLFGRRRL
jgi:branched-chain amino acid transport system permease protein